ncbi:hypothetical protein ERG27_07075 [Bacillus amyloliquefaciens]|nr:hypothetical protein BSO20_00485 [Bacillus amyloliquefaciens]AWE15617.1 hypothetical protein DDE72_05215 [Bacillus velezensis]QJC42580.1 hypothetical protein FHJ82_11540 [Bacillus sp. HNA3]MDE4457560.1 hypothetical protein [Bacillus amyloliquefaciens]QBK11745.1 hypothetical protein EYB46_18430 [Bacillus velezensis]
MADRAEYDSGGEEENDFFHIHIFFLIFYKVIYKHTPVRKNRQFVFIYSFFHFPAANIVPI